MPCYGENSLKVINNFGVVLLGIMFLETSKMRDIDEALGSFGDWLCEIFSQRLSVKAQYDSLSNRIIFSNISSHAYFDLSHWKHEKNILGVLNRRKFSRQVFEEFRKIPIFFDLQQPSQRKFVEVRVSPDTTRNNTASADECESFDIEKASHRRNLHIMTVPFAIAAPLYHSADIPRLY